MPADDARSETPAAAAPKSKKGLLIVAILMIVEGVGVFFVAQMLNSAPSAAAAADESEAGGGHEAPPPGESGGEHAKPSEHAKAGEPAKAGEHGKSGESGKKDGLVEMDLGECRPTNRMTGKLIAFQLHVSVLVAAGDADRVKTTVEAKQGRIRDRINFVIRSAEPNQLNEPGLEIIKRRLKHEFDSVLEDPSVIREVLIPELLQSGSGL